MRYPAPIMGLQTETITRTYEHVTADDGSYPCDCQLCLDRLVFERREAELAECKQSLEWHRAVLAGAGVVIFLLVAGFAVYLTS